MNSTDLLAKILAILKEAANIDGGTFVDLFAVVFIVRLLGPLKGFAPMNNAEAGIWCATIATFGYSNKGGPKQS